VSGVGRNRDPIGGATETQAQAASWLRQQHFEEWSEDRQAALNAWLGESLAHQVAYIRLEAAWNRTERVTALSRPMRNGLPHRFEGFRSKRFTIAAVAVFAVVAAALAVNYTAQPAEKSFATPVGGRETVSFADGSQIDLNTNTVLRARVSATSRTVTLERGEA
jgi:transmembrane sensor